MSDKLELGGNIELMGFSYLEGSTMVVLKKIIGNYAKQFSSSNPQFEKLQLSLSQPSEENDQQHIIKASLFIAGNPIESEQKEKNIYIAVDSALKKILQKG